MQEQIPTESTDEQVAKPDASDLQTKPPTLEAILDGLKSVNSSTETPGLSALIDQLSARIDIIGSKGSKPSRAAFKDKGNSGPTEATRKTLDGYPLAGPKVFERDTASKSAESPLAVE
jgi:hypothetical protein